MKRLTDDETLAELERLIELMRPFRTMNDAPEQVTYLALKASAADLRARQVAAIGETRQELEPAIDRLFESKSAIGYETNRMRAVAQIVAAHWPTVRFSLATLDSRIAAAEERATKTGVVR